MAKVIAGMTMSLDGFIQDRNGSVGRLYSDFETLREHPSFQDSIRTTGAVIMGKHTYDMGKGDYTGYEYQVPIFVLTHHVPERAAKGENESLSFTFVTGGIESIVRQAKAAAGERDVTVVGGPSTEQQLLSAGLVDELHVDVMPVLLGDGLRLFEHLDGQAIELEKISCTEIGVRTALKFRVIR